jgi:N-acetylglucosaminyldiphosphoundecaprenol N-acetyl-beta-D-mannosaminyltransferase
MLRLKELDIVESKDQLALIPEGKVLINTIYACSYVVAQRDDVSVEYNERENKEER